MSNSATMLLEEPATSLADDSDDSLAGALAELPAEAEIEPPPPPPAPAPEPLLAVVPPPAAPSLQELQAGLDNRHLIVIRLGLGISLATIFAITMAILIHVILGGGLYLSSLWYSQTLAHGTHSISDTESHDGGSGNGGYMLEGDAGLSGDRNAAGDAPKPQATPTVAVLPAPVLPAAAPVTIQAPDHTGAEVAMLHNTASDIIGIPSAGGALTAPKPIRAVPPSIAPAAPAELETGPIILVPPPRSGAAPAAKPVQVAMADPGTGTHGAGSVDRGGSAAGTGEKTRRPYNLMKSGAGNGNGRGEGNGNGDELDRGASGANLESPVVLFSPKFDIPLELHAKVLGKTNQFEFTVGADGTVSTIKLLTSSGSPEVDALCQAALAQFKCRPVFENGQPVAKHFTHGWEF